MFDLNYSSFNNLEAEREENTAAAKGHQKVHKLVLLFILQGKEKEKKHMNRR